jgi:hypothetical protein
LTLDELERLTPEPLFVRGDVQFDDALNITDALAIVGELFLGGAPLPCPDAADVNDDGARDISDAITLLMHVFIGNTSIPEPFAQSGADPSPDDLGC